MRDFIFSSDWHLNNTNSVRTGDIVGDLMLKINYVIDYCNEKDCQLIVGGDIFDKHSVPDYVKNTLITALLRLKRKAIVIDGNHDRRYDNEDYMNHTSLGNLIASKVVTYLTTIEYPDLVLTSEKPMINRGKPQIGMFHGFLNILDGKNTVLFSDIAVTDQTLVLLGHDHTEYEDLVMGPVTVIRPGSLIRGTRQDTNLRVPNMVRIRLKDDGTFITKKIPIESARDCAEIFKTKKVTLGKVEKLQNYDKIIEHIKNASAGDMSLQEGLKVVTTPDVCNYIQNLVDDRNLKNTK